jgi:hypothetical protein
VSGAGTSLSRAIFVLPHDPYPNTYNFRINDYVRAVEKALAETPPSRRRELLANLSERVQARRAALRAGADDEDLLSLFDEDGDRHAAREEARVSEPDDEVDGDHVDPSEAPVSPAREELMLRPSLEEEKGTTRRVGALAWVLVAAAAMVVMCVAAALTFIFFVVRASIES